MKNILKFIVVVFLFTQTSSIFSQQATKPADWTALKFLIGEWSGAPGEATGSFTFSYDLQKRILLRKNFAEYPAQNGRPAFRHDDLMIVYFEGGENKAVYFDNEGHTINYKISFSSDSLSTIFVSDIIPSAPRFRFSYTKIENDKMKFSFDIAPPGKPEEFTKYIDGIVARKK
ncbi:MAG: hypothetical protein NTX65_09405 [Ignavibacteriales bacterium]|nr:hypothetical protein [Ignavibacteriales bacterium]